MVPVSDVDTSSVLVPGVLDELSGVVVEEVWGSSDESVEAPYVLVPGDEVDPGSREESVVSVSEIVDDVPYVSDVSLVPGVPGPVLEESVPGSVPESVVSVVSRGVVVDEDTGMVISGMEEVHSLEQMYSVEVQSVGAEE